MNQLHLRLTHNIPVFLSVDFYSWNHAKYLSHKHSNSLRDKFSCLFRYQKLIYSSDLPDVNQNAVVKLSNTTLSEMQCSVLKLNSNFAISKQTPFPQLIAPIKKAFRNNPHTDTERNLCHLILANVKFDSINLN